MWLIQQQKCEIWPSDVFLSVPIQASVSVLFMSDTWQKLPGQLYLESRKNKTRQQNVGQWKGDRR